MSSSLLNVKFSAHFNKETNIGVLPESLVSLTFGEYFICENIKNNTLPNGILKLQFCGKINKYIIDILPNKLQKLILNEA